MKLRPVMRLMTSRIISPPMPRPPPPKPKPPPPSLRRSSTSPLSPPGVQSMSLSPAERIACNQCARLSCFFIVVRRKPIQPATSYLFRACVTPLTRYRLLTGELVRRRLSDTMRTPQLLVIVSAIAEDRERPTEVQHVKLLHPRLLQLPLCVCLA